MGNSIRKRILGLFLAIVTFVTAFIQPVGFVVNAADGITEAPPLKLSMEYKSGGNEAVNKGETDKDAGLNFGGTGNYSLVGRGKEKGVIANIAIDIDATEGQAEEIYLDLDLPFFYFDENGTFQTTYDKDSVPAAYLDENGKPIMAIVCELANPESVTSWDAKYEEQYTGHVHLQSRSLSVRSGNQINLLVHFYYKGYVPENTSGTIKLGGGYENYLDKNKKEYGPWSVYPQNVKAPEALYTLICSNLQWEASVEAVEPRNALWDKYNYLVYKVKIENTSEDAGSFYYKQTYRFALPNQGDSNAEGLYFEDAMKWIYNADGDPIQNDQFYADKDREHDFVGVPGQGGVMIYDVTDINQSTLDEWDFISFDNAVDDSGNTLQPLPYKFTQDASVIFGYEGNVYGSKDRENITDPNALDTSYKEFYVAIPMKTDIRNHQDPARIPADIYYTIKFGNNYDWTKVDRSNMCNGFADIENRFTHVKYVLDDDGKKVQNKYVAIGDDADYYLGNFANKGEDIYVNGVLTEQPNNVPAFNAAAVDTHNKDLDLQRISILFNYGIPFAYEAREPQLTDWFKETGTVEFGFYTIDTAKSTPEKTVYVLDPETKEPIITYVPLGTMVPDASLTTGTVKAWSLEIGNLLKDYESGNNSVYASTFKVKFKERIDPNEEFDGVIQVHGVVNKPIEFKNDLETEYETWFWLNKSAVNDKEGYLKTPHKVGPVSASVTATRPIPGLIVDAYKPLSDGTIEYKNSETVPDQEGGVGFRYKPYNTGISRVVPGILKSGTLASMKTISGGTSISEGLLADRIILSKELVEDISTVEKIDLYTTDNLKTPITVTPDKFKTDGDGNYYIDRTEWSGKELANFEITFKKFDKKIDADNDIFVLVEGSPNVPGSTIKVNSVFTTDYEDKDLNVKADASASLVDAPTVPRVDAQAIYTANGTTSRHDTLEVPLDVPGVGFTYLLSNDSISKIKPGVFSSGTLASDRAGNAEGLIADRIILSKKLVEDISVIESVDIYTTNDLTNPITVTLDKFKTDDDGNYYVDSDEWKGKGTLANFKINFNSFNSGVKKADDIFVSVEGTANIVKVHRITSTFSTNYADTSFNKSFDDPATLNIKAASPKIISDVFKTESDSTKTYGDPLNVPVNINGIGFRYRIYNNSISRITPGLFDSGTYVYGSGTDLAHFYTNKIVLSKKLVDTAKINSIYVYTVSDPTNPIIITPDKFKSDTDGNYYIEKEKATWSDKGELLHFEVKFDSFPNNINAADDEIFILAEGYSDTVRNRYINYNNYQSIHIVGTFKTDYSNQTNSSATDPADMRVDSISPYIIGQTFCPSRGLTSDKNIADVNNRTATTHHNIKVANQQDDSYYSFKIVNASVSPAGEGDISIDFTRNNVGDKTPNVTDVNVKGYLSKNITISKFDGLCDITSIKLYNWDTDPNSDPADVTIPISSIDTSGDSFTIDLSKYNSITYLGRVVIEFDEFYGNPSPKDDDYMTIKVDGLADWYEHLDADLTFNPHNVTMYDRVMKVTDCIYIDRPYATLHADVKYNKDLSGSAVSAASNTDGNQMTLGVPYDRDFHYEIKVGNGFISKLDDLDLTITLPVNDNKGAEANTGFHTTGFEFSKHLIDDYDELKTFTFYDVDHPDDGVKFVFDKAKGTFTDEAGKVYKVVNDKGDISIDEKTIFVDWNIKNLSKIVINGVGFAAEAPEDENIINIYGFVDSVFGTHNVMGVLGENWLAGLRQNPANRVESRDTADAYTSKMYFDTVINAGYKDIDTANPPRFDKSTNSLEHIRKNYYTTSTSAIWEDNSELDVGYKSIGSFMVDFRQYLNVKDNLPENTKTNSSHQEHENWSYVHTASLNTAANVDVKVNLEADKFDAYYLKVHKNSKDYIDKLTIERQDGTIMSFTKADWDDNSVELDTDGDQYYVIDLLQLIGEDSSIYYDIYKSPKDYVPNNPVKNVIVSLNINRMQADAAGKSLDPDYGTWYKKNNDATKYQFEITGRFYKEGKVTATAESTINVGDQISDREYAKAKDRTQNTSNVPEGQRSPWSYVNYYAHHWPGYTWGHEYWEPSDASHMFSRTNVYVYQEANYIAKGVHKSTSTKQDLNCTFSSYNEFAVSFYQGIRQHNNNSNHHDYLAGSGTSWCYQDAFDWLGMHAFTDKVVLEDTLPYVRTDDEAGYYGFLTQRIYISPKVYKYIDYIELFKQTSGSDSGTVVLHKDDFTGTATVTASPSGLSGNDEGVTHNDFYLISIIYPDSTDTNPKDNGYHLVLGENEFVTKYKIHLKDLPGDGDYASELAGRTDLLDSDNHDDAATPDVYVGGGVYRIKNDNIIDRDYNSMNATSYTDATPIAYFTSGPDKALLNAYRVPFQGGYLIHETSKPDHIIYDYETGSGAKQNIEPNVAAFEIKVWNRPDDGQEAGRSANIDSATVTASMHTYYRLSHIYIPAEFITGKWFNVESLVLNYGAGSSITYDFNKLIASKYFAVDPSDSSRYVFDLNLFVKDNLGAFNVASANNYVKGDKYYQAYISSFKIKLTALDKKNNPLDGGEFLNPNRESLVGTDAKTPAQAQPTITYDGVYVDRTEADIKSNSWTKKSKPTVINSANTYVNDTAYYNTLSLQFTSPDRDAEPYNTNWLSNTTDRDYYCVRNIVSTMLVDLKRTTELKDGSKTFAYDVDNNSYAKGLLDDKGNKVIAVDSGHLLPDDYIEYQLSIGTASDAMIPLYRPGARMIVKPGQRIVGWYVLSNDTKNFTNDDITATVKGATGNITVEKGKYYSLENVSGADTETLYRQIDFAFGSASGTVEENQMLQGEKAVLVIVTQLTDELSPFEGEKLTPIVYAYSHPEHTYSQYKIDHMLQDASGALKSDSSSSNVSSEYTYYGSGTGESYYRYSNTFSTNPVFGEYQNENTYVTDIRSSQTFYRNPYNLSLSARYDTSRYYDEMPMTFNMGSTASQGYMINDTYHSLESAVFTVSFLSNANGRLYKGFDLTQKAEFPYPENVDQHKGETASAEYCYFVDSSDNVIGTDIGIYETTAPQTEKWISEGFVVESFDGLTDEQIASGKYYLLKDAVKVRWTYYDIPAGSAADPIVFIPKDNPYLLKGHGRYRDIRTDAQKKNTAANDIFTITFSGDFSYTHKHSEVVENTVANVTGDKTFSEKMSFKGSGSYTINIVRERPILSLHTQIFDDEAKAEAPYNANATQLKGYRPGDKIWYKSTVKNIERTFNYSGTNYKVMGALLDPVIYDKLPEYITTGLSKDNIKIVWYDAEGNAKPASEIPDYEIIQRKIESPDFGGDMVTSKSDTDGIGSSPFASGHMFADINLNESKGNTDSTDINYNVYAIQFEKGSRLEIGERIEVYYEAQIRYEDLPLAYTTRACDGGSKTFVDYYPKMSEYYQASAYYSTPFKSYPYIGDMNYSGGYGSLTQFKNANVMMDMNYLYHDVGVSGTRNKNIDRYDYLKDSFVYMPGTSSNDENYGGKNGILKDYDVNIDSIQQSTIYSPRYSDDLYGHLNDMLPTTKFYVDGSGYGRDWYNLMMSYRERSADWQNVDVHEDAVIWAESRIHLQTAWLATSSQMISNESDYLASTEYLPTAFINGKYDTVHYPYQYYGNANTYARILNDDNITALEYDQYFTSRLGAYNYGDWDLTSGIEFYYVMPQGIEPTLKADNKTPDFSNVKAYIMNGGTSNAPQYEEINEDLVDISVVQTPYDSTINYLTPQIMQDPILSDSTMNRTGDSYVGKDSYYSADEHKSWVFKVTVKKTLGKWFNRGSNTGYMMFVDIPSHVYSTPKDEYWYDEVMAKPLDTSDQDSLYYQIYDITTLWGNNYLPKMPAASRASSQYGGMDYLWNSYYYYTGGSGNCGPNGNFYFVNGSPNMPYINGMNISNREVTSQGEIFDSGKDNFSSGVRNTFASTGSRAHMRKPFIRTWTTVGKDNIDGYNAKGYYVDAQGDTSTLNIHVENKYWNNTLAVDYTWPSSHGSYSGSYYRVKHKYSTDGGNKGTLYYPVVTDILPKGIVPKDTNGDLFTKDNEYNATKELAWNLYGADYSGNTRSAIKALDDEKALYSAKVEYIELDCEDESTEGRYMVTFWQKDTDIRLADKTKISSESSRVFSFDFFTQNGPDDLTEDFETNTDLLDQYQSNKTFVSSELENFKFIIDSETANGVEENPFYVGNKLVTKYKESYNASNDYYASNNVVDARHDISGTKQVNNGNTLPLIYVSNSNKSLVHFTNEAIDATVDKGDLRYFADNGKLMIKKNYSNATEEFNFEDYYDIRQDVRINAKDIDKLDAHNPTGDIGVYTSNRIRCTRPNIENQTFVSYDPALDLDDLGKRSPNGLKGDYEYYPDETTPVNYMDNLYYNIKIDNPKDKTDYYNRGNIAHGIIRVTAVLPSILSFTGSYYKDDSILNESLYLIYKDSDGNVTEMRSLSDLYDNGYTLNIISDSRNADGNEVLVFEIITAGDYNDPDAEPTYSDFVHGKHLPGYFGADETLVLGIKTLVTNNVFPPSSVMTGDRYWDNEIKADSYVTFDDITGSYLTSYDDEAFEENLDYLDDARIIYTRPTEDNIYDDIDWDCDTDFNDSYAQDVSAVITLLKPHAVVRLDTSVQRIEVINPDLLGNMKRAVDDPTVKGSSRTAVYLDQVVNDGSSVRSFFVDYRVPFRGTVEGTREEAPVTADWIPNRLYAVGTGKWEIPESAGSEEYREALKEKLRVKVYAMFVEDPKLTDDGYEDADVSYEGINNLWEGDWINLTELHNKKTLGINSDSVPIYENSIIDITSVFDELPGTVYQLRYVIESDDPEYIVPHGFRLAVDADDDSDNGSQEMDEIDPNRENVNPLSESVTSDIVYNTDGTVNYGETRVGNAAFVVTTMTNMHPRKRHVNFFASAMAHYDETASHKAVISERDRAGYYITRELPVLETDLSAQYFKNSPNLDPETGEELNWSFKWDNDILISSSSHMLKFSSSLRNLSQEAIDETNIKNTKQDTATNVQMSVVLPFIQDIDSTIESQDEDFIEYKNYKYVEYGSDAWKNSVDKDYESPKAFPGNFTPVWTWHVENEDGEVINSQIDSVALVMEDKITDITNSRERRVLTFSSEGVLNPGEKILIDLMLPISTSYSGIVSEDLMNCKNFGFKSGAFVPYIPQVEASSKTYAYEVDTRDVNSNEIRNSENTVTTSISVISFVSEAAFNRSKVSFSEYGSGNNVMGNDFKRPSLVPEGTRYSFLSSIINPDTDPQSPGYKQPVIYDVLPFVGDTTLTPQVGNVVKDRGSDWRGYLQLESLEVISQIGVNKTKLVNNKDVDIWIGPFKTDNKAVGKIKELDISELPSTEQTSDTEFYKLLRSSTAEKQKYFVKLTDLLSLKTSNKDRFEELQKHAQAIYVEPKASYHLTPNTMLSVSYELKAPLNLPLFDGYSPEDTSETLVADVADVDGWNTFTAQTEERPVTESPEAGVYLASPADKGYIGHYVWLDESYNAEFFDEADYYQRDGKGRWILDKATKDLNYDGKIDDPGINNVKVELLSAKGYPVNKLGEPVVEVDGRYCIVDETTGLLKRDTANNLVYTTLGPVSYTTEKDAYGNDGYFIISNITPGNYKLRYTFPETGEYDKYAITTRRIGQTKVPMTVYRPGSTLPNLGNAGKGDEPSDGATVNTLVIQTDSAIRVDAIGTDPSKYSAYDEKMTSYDLGVAPSFAYGGYAWREISSQINGLKDSANATTGFRKENGIKDILIAVYEVIENPDAVDEFDRYDYRYAYDADGKQITGRYSLSGDTQASTNKRVYLRTDADGYFKTTLYPYKSYIAVAYHEDSLAPSPVTLSSYPLKFPILDTDPQDNDMAYNSLMDRDTTSVFAVDPTNDEYEMGKCVNGQYGTYNRLGFGFTSTGIGSIGKYVFIDENYDGIRSEYIDDAGYIVSEHGLENVRFVLERWYYNPAATKNKWVKVGDVADTVSVGNAYTFVIDNDDFYYTVDDPGSTNYGKTYVCGYKVKVDMDSVDEVSKNTGTHYVATKYLMNDGVSDSNLPLTGDNYRYLNDVPVIANEIVDEADLDPTNPEQLTIDGVTYDMSRGRSITDLDAGFATVDTAHIKGIVWNDKNYDGIRNTTVDEEGNVVPQENGVGNVELQLVPYVYHKDSKNKYQWYPLTAEDLADPSIYDEYNTVTTKSDSDGVYDFSGVRPTAVLNDALKNELCIVGYKIKVNSNITDMGYGITKYLTNGKVDDSELRVDKNGVMVLNSDNDYIITARKIAEEDLDHEYGSEDIHKETNHKELLIQNTLGYFDVNKVTDYEGNDAGLVQFQKNTVSGRVWVDTNYDGIMDDTELGMENIKLTVKRYYLENGGADPEEGIGTWVEDTTFKSPTVKSDKDGNYIFKDLPAQVYKNGNYYLAGYKVFVVDHPDMSTYAITLYGTYGENQRGSDLKDKELIEDDEYIVLANPCGTYDPASIDTTAGSEAGAYKNLSYVVKYQGTYYDVVAPNPKTELDTGYTDYKYSVIKGNVFEDIDYDGLYNGDDSFTDALKEAIYNSYDEKVIITATAFFYDSEEDEWNVYSQINGFNFMPETFTTEVTVDSDGSFELAVPTRFNIGGVNYLAGYKLNVNIIPDEFHVTKYLVNNGIDDNVLNKNDEGDYWLTKTYPGAEYTGTLMEEKDGFVIAAAPSDKSESSNIVCGYDIAGTRTLEDYNIGYTVRQVASIGGYVYKDNNYNGKYDLRNTDVPLTGIRIGLKRYVLNEETNTWEDANGVDDNGVAKEYYKTIRTDRNGRYDFLDLPTHREAGEYGDIPLLYGYTVWLTEMPADENGKPLAATYYQYNHDRYDSALIADTMQIIKDDQGNNGPGEYYSDTDRLTIIADAVDEDDSLQYVVSGYNIVQGMSRTSYSVGLVDYQKASIVGNVFDDTNYSGLIDEENPRFDDFEIGLKRYKLVDGEWISAQFEKTEFFKVVKTDANGDYVFDNLDIYTEENDANVLYGYELYVVHAPKGFEITKYQVNDGSNDSAVRLDNQIIKQDTSLDEMYDDKLVLADKHNKGVDPSYMIDGYDIVRAHNLDDYNAGYIEQRLGTISGTVFDDESYDGTFDTEEKGLSGVEITLKRFTYVDGKWEDDKDYVNTVSTDKNGNYIFDNLETYIEEDGVKYLVGYEVWVAEQPAGYEITRYQNDSKVLLDGHIIKPETKLDELIDGKIVVASIVEEDTTGIEECYIVDGRNVILAENIKEYDAGYKAQEKGSISGIIFDDINYDANLDEEDGRLEDVEVTLKRFIYENNEWTEDTEFDVKTLTDKDGAYIFDNLDTYKAMEDGNHLYGYEVWVTDGTEGYAVTKYMNDSYLLVNGQIIKPDTKLPEMLDGKIVVAEPAADKSGVDESFIVEDYNIVLADHMKHYNGGLTIQEYSSIEGNVFDDMNYDGIIDENDTMLQEVQIGLKRFIYEDGEWKLAQPEDAEYYQTTVTDEDGHYIFDNLDIYVNDGENKLYGYELYVIGIEDRFVTKYQMNNGENDSALRDVTYQIIKKDTELSEMLDGKMVLAQSAKEQENPNTPYIVEGYDVVKGVHLVQYNAGLVPVREYHISGYVWNDINRDGLISEDEKYMSGVNVTLERYYFLDGQWYALPEEEEADNEAVDGEESNEENSEIVVQNEDATETEEISDICVTDKNGFYSFNDLPLSTVVDGRIVVCGYKVKIEELPSNYAVTVLHANEFTVVEDDTAETEDATEAEDSEVTEDTEETAVTLYDSDLNDKTGYLEDGDVLIVLADLADETTPESYNIDNFNISYGESVEHLDAGLIPFGVGSIAGILFEDANENGVYDDGELIFEGETIYLDYFLADKQENDEESKDSAEGEFVSFKNKKVKTDENGYFIFENLPILDEDGNPYQYKLDMKKPSERDFTTSFAFIVMGEDKLNILSHASGDDENAGTTPVISVAIPRTDKNYYNLKWQIDGYNHSNAYLGLSQVDTSEKVNTGIEGSYFYVLIPVASAIMLLAVLYSKKKKRKETD